MKPMAALVRRLGLRRARAAVVAGAVVLLLAGAGLGTLLVAPRAGHYVPGLVDEARTVVVAGDADLDGLPDAVENRLGSDPARSETLGAVPDGWLVHWLGDGIDWSDPALLQRPALVAPPDALPEALRDPGAIDYPSLAELYAHEKEARSDGLLGAWWLEHPGLDPTQWDNDGDGIADAWLLSHGVDPVGVQASEPAPGDAAMTLREKYEHGLDPSRDDSDGDGLLDREELAGSATFGTRRAEFPASDPRRASSAQDGVADGYAAWLGLDPREPTAAARTWLPGGLSVLEAYRATLTHCERAAGVKPSSSPSPSSSSPPTSTGSAAPAASASVLGTGACKLRAALTTGPVADPRKADSNGDGVPEAWAVREPSGLVDPLADARKQVVATSAEWDRSTWAAGNAPSGLVVDPNNPAPAKPYEVTAAQLYLYERPSNWTEQVDGPWPFGLPVRPEPGPGGLPPAVGLRGWNLTLDLSRGRNATAAADPAQQSTIHAAANPSQADSDGDGLTDAEEYFGTRPGKEAVRPRTNALDPDSDGDGLSDRDEDRYGTDPLRQDSAGSYLTDGEKVAYWTERFDNASRAFADDFTKATQDYHWLAPDGDPSTQLARLLPAGDPDSGGGDLDGDGLANVLDPDSDGDSLADGVELHPDEFLPDARGALHPPTDPARTDSDGDRLPDGWEVEWSREPWPAVRPSDCKAPCLRPDNGVVLDHFGTWPINPALTLSWSGLAADITTDADVDLTAESLPVGSSTRHFSNALARTYDLDPYSADGNGDGIPNLYAIQWGVQGVPGYAQAGAPEWARQAASRLRDDLVARGFQDAAKSVGSAVAIPPKETLPEVGAGTNLLGLFTDREKGTWVYAEPPQCDASQATLPATGPRREAGYGSDGDRPADRTGLKPLTAGRCWAWHPFTLGDEVSRRTDPWLHAGIAHDQQVPDAWLEAYGLGADLPTYTQSSVDKGCKDAVGLPPKEPGHYCITPALAYAHGLDPRPSGDHAGDTDQGSVPDWEELALGLDPLDPNDDYGNEDWDGDGLPNFVEFGIGTGKVDADSDHDGLLDGDLNGVRYAVQGYDQIGALDGSHDADRADRALGFFGETAGNGNLCIPHGVDAVQVPNTQHRPGGPLTYGSLRAGLLSSGVLSEAASPSCPTDAGGAHGDLFLREAILLRRVNETVGAGVSSDSHKPSTAGDGVPDGWKVYWARRHQDAPLVSDALDPKHPGRFSTNPDGADPDGDFASTAAEYGLADGDSPDSRPPGWSEARDGVWWGGSDPGAGDSDGDRGWFRVGLDAGDLHDGDLDNDGIPDSEDPFPADHANRATDGVVRWDGARYRTDFTRLWAELAARPASALRNGDGDPVPDFLDRARVAVTAGAPTPATVTKGQAFTVAGAVALAEPAGGSGSAPEGAQSGPVGGATVRLVASDGSRDALVGYGFTDAAGRFTVTGKFADAVDGPDVPPGGASVGGRYAASGRPALDGSAGMAFKPGALTVRVEVEANDATLQKLTFAGQPSAAARKDVPYDLPRARGPPAGLVAVALAAGGNAPDPGNAHLRHSAQAIFHNASALAPLTLKDKAVLSIQASPQQVLLGDRFNATGLLMDGASHPLGGKAVALHLKQGSREVALSPVTTAEDGTFRSSNVSTEGWAPGPLAVRADVDLGAASEPASALATVTVIEATRWSAATVQGATCGVALCPDGSRIVALPGSAPRVGTVLRDHRGAPVADRAVSATLADATGTRSLGALRTAADGSLTVTLPAFREDGEPETRTLRLAQAGSASGTDDPFELFVEPRFATRVAILHGSGATAPVGTAVNITGRLERLGGDPIASPAAQIGIRFVPGGTSVVVGTDHDGRFNVTVLEDEPGLRSVLVSYLGSDDPGLRFLRPSPPAYANVTHAFPVRLALDPATALRGGPVNVTGALARLPAGGYPQLKPLPPAQQPFVCQVNLGSRRTLGDDAFYLAFRADAPEAGAHLQDGDLRLVPPDGRAAGTAIADGDDAEKGQPFAAACLPAAVHTVDGPAQGPLVLLDTGARDGLANGPAGAAEGPGVADIRLTPGALRPGTLVSAGDADAAAPPLAAEPAWSFLFQDADRSGVFTAGAGDRLVLSQAPPTGGPQAPGDVLLGPGAAVLGTAVQAGVPVPDAAVEVAWRGNGSAAWVPATTGPDGRFTATLPAREAPGEAALDARYAGDATHLPDSAAANATIRPRNTLALTLDRLAFGPDGARLDPRPWGNATADSGGLLAGLPVDLTLTAPGGTVSRATAMTDANGTFNVDTKPETLAEPGFWSFVARGGGAEATARVAVVHQARIAVDLAPTEAAAGAPVDLAGHVDGPLPGVEVHVALSVDGGAIASFLAWTGRDWSARVAMPALGDKPATITLSGDGGDGVEVLGAEVTVSPIHPIEARLTDTIGPDGRRTISIQATDSGGRPPPAGLEIVLVEGDGDSALSHTVRLDPEGRGTLDLGYSAEPVRAVALRDPALRLASVSSEATGHRIATTATPTVWVPYVAAAAAALGVVLLGAWLLWGAARRRRLRAAFLQAHTLLLGGKPARQAIRDLYGHILGVLREAGYEPDAAETVRTIATRATAEFRLPPAAMYDLTSICERVLYSRHEPTPAEREAAIRSAAAIADRLRVPFFVRRTVRA